MSKSVVIILSKRTSLYCPLNVARLHRLTYCLATWHHPQPSLRACHSNSGIVSLMNAATLNISGTFSTSFPVMEHGFVNAFRVVPDVHRRPEASTLPFSKGTAMTLSEQQSVINRISDTHSLGSLPSLELFSPTETQPRTDGPAHYQQLCDENLNTSELRAMNQLQQGRNTAAAVLSSTQRLRSDKQRFPTGEGGGNDTWQEVLLWASLSPVLKGDRI